MSRFGKWVRRHVLLLALTTVASSVLFVLMLRQGTAPAPALGRLPLKTGDTLVAETPSGRIEIVATSVFERTYRWGGECEGSAELARGERSNRINYLVSPGFGHHWSACGGVSRGVLQEGVKEFRSAHEADAWINKMTLAWNTELRRSPGTQFYVPVDEGVIVGWGIVSARMQLDVEVWRILIDGKYYHGVPTTTEYSAQIIHSR